MKLFASYPDVSLFRWKFARKERREGEKGRAPLLFLLPMVHCDSSPVTGVSRSPLCGINTKHLRRKKISAHHLVLDRRDKNQYVVAEFYPWFKFYVLLLQNYTTFPPPSPPPTHPPKKKEREENFNQRWNGATTNTFVNFHSLGHIWAFWNIMLRKKESPIGVTNYFKSALHEKLHKSDKRAGEILFNRFVVHALFLKRGRAGGEKRRRCHTWPHEEVCYHFSWYILPTS